MPSTQLLDLEGQLKSEPDPAKRLEVIQDFRFTPVPEDSILGVIVDVLMDAEPAVREETALVLLQWDRKAVLAVMTALRGTAADKVDRRRTLIQMLSRFGAHAAIAETLLRAYGTDESVGKDAMHALARIRNDWGELFSVLGSWGTEYVLLTAVVAMPAVGIVVFYRPENQPFPWVPTIVGILGGVVALLLARAACGVFHPRGEDERSRRKRTLTTTIGLGIVGLLFGLFIGGIAVSSKASVERTVPAGNSN